MEFNFEEWAALAAKDPAAFEERRRAALMQVVNSGPERLRESGAKLVDELCAPTTDTPLEKAVLANNLMMRSVVKMQASMTDLVSSLGAASDVAKPSTVASFTRLEARKD